MNNRISNIAITIHLPSVHGDVSLVHPQTSSSGIAVPQQDVFPPGPFSQSELPQNSPHALLQHLLGERQCLVPLYREQSWSYVNNVKIIVI